MADVLNVGRTHRLATLKQRRAIHARQNGVCAVPGCTNPALDIHHVIWWSRGGRTDLDELIGICPKCHALVHRELLHIEVLGRGRFAITQPGGRISHRHPPEHTARRELRHIRRLTRELQHRHDHHYAVMRT